MNLDPIRNAVAELTGRFHQLLQSVTNGPAIWPAQDTDDGSGLLMPAVAGAAAAVTVALLLVIYFRTGYRSYRDMIRHGLAAAVGLSVLAFVIYDVRNATVAHVAKTPIRPAVQFDLKWQTAMDRTMRSAPEAHLG